MADVNQTTKEICVKFLYLLCLRRLKKFIIQVYIYFKNINFILEMLTKEKFEDSHPFLYCVHIISMNTNFVQSKYILIIFLKPESPSDFLHSSLKNFITLFCLFCHTFIQLKIN